MKGETKYFASYYDSGIFRDKNELKDFLLIQGVNKETFEFFRNMQMGIKASIYKNKITEMYECSLGYNSINVEELIGKDITLPIEDWDEHDIFFLAEETTGSHIFGGKKPGYFKLPKCKEMKTSFQYIGKINTRMPEFSWIGLDELLLAFPLYESNFGIYLDYSNSNAPVVLNPDTFNDAWYNSIPEYAKNNKEITFSETRFKVVPKVTAEQFEENDHYHIGGVPIWYQYPIYPRSPKTGKLLKFVCSIYSNGNNKVMVDGDVFKDDFRDRYMCFGDAEHLYVFYDTESKVLYLESQG